MAAPWVVAAAVLIGCGHRLEPARAVRWATANASRSGGHLTAMTTMAGWRAPPTRATSRTEPGSPPTPARRDTSSSPTAFQCLTRHPVQQAVVFPALPVEAVRVRRESLVHRVPPSVDPVGHGGPGSAGQPGRTARSTVARASSAAG
ncbi:hypothetical protein GCM10009678_74890 [Actinomadura kijaniata]